MMRAESDAVAATALQRLVAASDDGAGFLGRIDRLLLGAGALLAPKLPAIVVPAGARRLRQLVGHLVLDATPKDLAPQLAGARDAVGAALNVNLLGEAVLGAAGARRRRQATTRPDRPGRRGLRLGEALLDRGPDRHSGTRRPPPTGCAAELRPLCRAAMASTPPTFVNLDVGGSTGTST